MKNFIKYTLAIIMAFFLSGCLAATKVSPQAQSKYQQFQREEGTALLYIVRTSAFGGGAVTTFHSINGTNLGELGNGDAHVMVALEPGTYTLNITGDLGLAGRKYEKQFTVAPNEDKLIRYELMDLMYGNYNAIAFDRSAILNTKLSNFTHLVSPKAVAKRKKEQELFQKTKEANTIKAYEEFQENYPSSKYAKEARKFAYQKREAMKKNPEKKKEVHNKIEEYLNNKDIDGLVSYMSSDAEIKEFVRNDSKAYLLVSGPKELPIVKMSRAELNSAVFRKKYYDL